LNTVQGEWLVIPALKYSLPIWSINVSVAEPHHFYAAPASGENLDAAPAAPVPAPAPTLLYRKEKFLKRTTV
jgi:hypothetical protein